MTVSTALPGPDGPAWDQALAAGIAWANSLTTPAGVRRWIDSLTRRINEHETAIADLETTIEQRRKAGLPTMAAGSDLLMHRWRLRTWQQYHQAAIDYLATLTAGDHDD